MRKIICFIVAAFLLPGLSVGQIPNRREQGLQIGDQVPDVTITNIINYKTPTVKISDFKGKLLILDFWATWCSPCVAMIPKMDSLQKQFEGKVQFLPVAYQSEKEIGSFLKKLEKQKGEHYSLPDVTGDKDLQKLFPHQALPHYVWIDGAGIVRAITSHTVVCADTIRKMLRGDGVQLPQKIDETGVGYDKQKPLLFGGNGGHASDLLYHTLLSRYLEGVIPGYSILPSEADGSKRIVIRNVPLTWFYMLAYGEGKKYLGAHDLVLDVRDTSRLSSDKTGNAYDDWLKQGNGYSYEIRVPAFLADSIYAIMREDFNRLFYRYRVHEEKHKTRCLALVRTSGKDKLASKGGEVTQRNDKYSYSLHNAPLGSFVQMLHTFYLQKLPYPVVDETHYTGRVDLDLDASLSDVSSLNRALEKYDLQFVEKEAEVPVLVISDRVKD